MRPNAILECICGHQSGYTAHPGFRHSASATLYGSIRATRFDPDSIRLEIHRDAVDAVALMGRRRAVGKHVAEMAAAAATMHLGALHAVAAVRGRFDRTRL